MTERRPTRRQIQRVHLGKMLLLAVTGALIVWLWLAPSDGGTESETLVPVPTVAATAAVALPTEATAVATPYVNIPTEMDAGTIILSGAAELPGAPVEILVDGEMVGETAVNQENTWTLALELTTPGSYLIETRIYDIREEADELFYQESIEVTVRPNVIEPSLDLSGEGRLQEGMITLNGRGEPHSTIEIVVNGEVAGTAEIGADGRWSFPFAAGEPGAYELQLRMLDGEGTLLAMTSPSTLILEPPLAEEAEADFMAPLLGEEALTAGDTLTLTGQIEPGTAIEFLLDGELLETVTADADGRWSWPFVLPDAGQYEFLLRVLDEGGEMVASKMAVLAVEARAEPEAAGETRPFTVADPIVDEEAAELLLSGTGRPGSQVIVALAGEPLGGVLVDQNGEWALVVDLPVEEGATITLENVSATGEETLDSREITLAAGAAETPEATETAEAAVGTPTPVPTSAGLVNNPLQISYPAEGDVLDDSLIRLLGTGPARQQIEILDNGVPVGRTTVPDSGIWRYSFGAESGTHALSVRLLTDPESETEPFMVTLNKPPVNPACENPEPGQDLGDRYIVGDCEWLIKITNRLGVDYDAVLALNPEIEDPNQLFPGQVILLPPREE